MLYKYLIFDFWLSNQFVAATQPINALAFVLDGVNFGASDFAYTAYSMVSSYSAFVNEHKCACCKKTVYERKTQNFCTIYLISKIYNYIFCYSGSGVYR